MHRTALLLGYFGLVPFVGLTLLVMFGPAGSQGEFALAQRAYAAVILSFVGAVIWGRALGHEHSSPGLYLYAVLPALIAWAALYFHPLVGLWLLAGAFVLALVHDLVVARRGLLPRWYARLRIVLTAVVTLCLVTSALIV